MTLWALDHVTSKMLAWSRGRVADLRQNGVLDVGLTAVLD